MRQDVRRIKKKLNYITGMFPYNDEENAWISGRSTNIVKSTKYSLTYSLLCAIFAALLSAIIPPLIYFFK